MQGNSIVSLWHRKCVMTDWPSENKHYAVCPIFPLRLDLNLCYTLPEAAVLLYSISTFTCIFPCTYFQSGSHSVSSCSSCDIHYHWHWEVCVAYKSRLITLNSIQSFLSVQISVCSHPDKYKMFAPVAYWAVKTHLWARGIKFFNCVPNHPVHIWNSKFGAYIFCVTSNDVAFL